MRCAIYACYSSDNQREASIDDQVRVCRALAEREGWTVSEVYADHGISGATANRPRFQQMLADARAGGRFEIILAEALDRLSRDQEHVAGFHKQTSFAGIRVVTIAEGDISELHVGLKGTMSALFLKDLAQKTHRGLEGRVRAGRSAGGIAYGYDVVRHLDEHGEPVREDRAINPAEVAVVRRIFSLFAEGHSPIAIARLLNAEHVPGPEGRTWRDTTIRGHALRATGILRNELYIGRLVWNRMRFLKDPFTGKRVSRMNPRAEWVVEQVPELRIVDLPLWDRAQARLGEIRAAAGADNPDRPRYWEQRRAQHVLTGKVFCGCCGGVFTNVGRDYLACSAAKRQGVCENRASIRRQKLDDLVLDALRTRLMAPALVAEFIREFTAEWNRLLGERSADRAPRERELVQVQRKLAGLIDALAEGIRVPGVQQKLDDLDARRTTLEAELKAPPPLPVRMHPNLAEVYRQHVASLHDALRADPEGREALDIVRTLIERIEVHPAPDGGMEIEVVGELAAMVRLGMGEPAEREAASAGGRDLFARSVKVVAGTGFEPVTFRL